MVDLELEEENRAKIYSSAESYYKMSESITLEYVLNLAKQLSPLDRIRLIEQITPRLKRNLVVSPSQPHKSLTGILEGIDIIETNIDEVKAEISLKFPREDI